MTLQIMSGKIKTSVVALLLTFPVTEFVLSGDQVKVLWLLVLAVIVDIVLGLWNALARRRWASWRMGQPTAKKVSLYAVSLFSVFILGLSHWSFGWMFEYLCVYYIISEILSIFEKLALLGLRLPQRIISRVNEVFEMYVLGDKEAEKLIQEKKM